MAASYGWQAPRIGTVAKPRRPPPIMSQPPAQSTLPMALNLLKQKQQRGGSGTREWGRGDRNEQEEPPAEDTPEDPQIFADRREAQQMHPAGRTTEFTTGAEPSEAGEMFYA